MPKNISAFGTMIFEGENTEDQWDDVCNALQIAMDKIAETALMPYYWHGDSINFGWRQLHGTADLHKEKAEDLLFTILPKTDCHFLVYVDYETNIIRIQNYHHDNPTGNEWYVIKPQEPEKEEE